MSELPNTAIPVSPGKQDVNPAISNFTPIFKAASDEYKRLTKKDLQSHPFAAQFDGCDSPRAVLDVFKKQAQAFEEFRKDDDKLMKFLDPTINVLSTLSATIGEGLALVPFSPTKMIFAGISLLLTTAKDVVSNHSKLVDLFERVRFFLQRLNITDRIQLPTEMMELYANIMAQVLLILALSTKEMAQSRFKKFLKRLVGLKKTDVEDALQRLDMLTTQEIGLVGVSHWKTTDGIAGKVEKMEESMHNVDGSVNLMEGQMNDVAGDVKEIKELNQDMADNAKATRDLTQDMGGNVKGIMENIKDVDCTVKEFIQHVDDNVEPIKELFHNAVASAKAEEAARNKEENERKKESLRLWLNPPNPSINHKQACGLQHDGTATWFIEDTRFKEWKMNGSLLWIRGNPGSGKSILCSSIIEDIKRMQNAESILVAYYYFDFKDILKRDLCGLLSSLIFQLCEHSDRCWDILSQLHIACDRGLEQPNEIELTQCLQNILEHLGQEVPVYIIVDALDECPHDTGMPSPREMVLEFLENLVGSKRPNLYICLTSRPEQDIQAILNPLISDSRRISLHEEGGQREDILNYVRHFVHNDRIMRRWRAEDKELVIDALSERADGMFRWVYCQLDTLRRCIPASIRRALNELPTTLDETYARTLKCIPREKWQYAHRLFQCLIAAIRPLRAEELAEIFAIEFDQDVATKLVECWRPDDPEEAILSVCSSLITVIDDRGWRVVQFSHFSVKEFLTSSRLATSNVENISHYYIDLEPAHTILARACLTVLLQLDDKADKKRLATLPLAFYAAQYWVDHAKFKDVQSQIWDAMKCLFDVKKPHLAAWTWIHDVDSGRHWSINSLADHPPPLRATPLYYAILCGFSGLVSHLLTTHPEDVNTKGGYLLTALHAAKRAEQLDCIPLLLELGADVNARYEDDTVLHLALDDGQDELVKLLLRYGADVNAKGMNDWTPLHVATTNGNEEVVRLLLKYGADVNARNISGDTALVLASKYGHIELVRLLLSLGVDVYVSGEGNLTPIAWAAVKGHREVGQLLWDYITQEG